MFYSIVAFPSRVSASLPFLPCVSLHKDSPSVANPFSLLRLLLLDILALP